MTDDTENLSAGFSEVDRQPDPNELFAAMDDTARWPAVQRLRGWEREQLDLREGLAVVDVGCGTGDMTRTIAEAVMPGGRALGIDFSAEMVEEARRRHEGTGAEFEQGDASSLPADDGSFDSLRSERTLQWVTDAASAVREFARVLKPGGTAVVTDTDWRTFTMDHPDQELVDTFTAAMRAFRGDGIAVGGKLVGLFHDSGFDDVRAEVASHAWTSWDPDRQEAPPGFLPLRRLAQPLASTGVITVDQIERLVGDLADQARRGRLFMTVTMCSVAGRRR